MFPVFENGLVEWGEREIRRRQSLIGELAFEMRLAATRINRAWDFHRIESPVMMPVSMVNYSYSSDDFFCASDTLALRPETTAGSYEYAKRVVEQNGRKALPLCVWQAGLSFRNEQDKTLKHMRLKAFYQQEFQFVYTSDSKADYVEHFRNSTLTMFMNMFLGNRVRAIPSDRIPSYSNNTIDIEVELPCGYWMEVCSMSDRKDCPIENTRNIEIAIGLDRLVRILCQ